MSQYASNFGGMSLNLSVWFSDCGLLWLLISVLVGAGRSLVTKSRDGDRKLKSEEFGMQSCHEWINERNEATI